MYGTVAGSTAASGATRCAPALARVRARPARRVVVEVRERARAAAGVVGSLGGHRIAQFLLDLPVAEVGGGRRARDAAAVPGAVIGDHVGAGDQARGPHGHQVGVAGTDPDAGEAA